MVCALSIASTGIALNFFLTFLCSFSFPLLISGISSALHGLSKALCISWHKLEGKKKICLIIRLLFF